MRLMCLFLMTGGFLLSGGCSMEGKSKSMIVIARPIEGEELYATSTITRRVDWRGKQIKQPHDVDDGDYMFIWKRPCHQEKRLVVSADSPPGAVREIVLILVTDKPSVQVRTSEGGSRVWLIHLNRVIASFDYVAGVAIFGDKGHPNWAVKPGPM